MVTKLFKPESVAVVGASRSSEKVGYAVLKNLLEVCNDKFRIYPVNPKAEEILGLNKCYPDLKSIEDVLELVVVAVPAKVVPNIIEDCGKKQVPFAIVLSAGFKETGTEGAFHSRQGFLKTISSEGQKSGSRNECRRTRSAGRRCH